MKLLKTKGLVGLLMIMSLIMGGCTSTGTDQGLTVDVTTVEEGTISSELNLTGVLLPNDMVNISSKASGQVLNTPKKVGDQVSVGDVLLELDTKTLEAQLKQAEAGLSAAYAAYDSAQNQAALLKISLAQTEKTYLDSKALYETGAISEGTYTDITSKYELAKRQYENAAGPLQKQAAASVENAKASINTLEVQKENSMITSPIDGVLVSMNVQDGEIASPGMPLLAIADLSVLKMKSTIPQEYLPFVSENEKVNMKIDIYPDQEFEGTINTIGPMSVSTGKIFPIEFAILNDSSIMAGLSARVSIEVNGKQHMVVPANAVVNAEGQSYVFVITDNVASKTEVVTGLNNEDSIEILSGLEKGQVIAVTNTHILQDQMLVNVAEH